MKIKINEKYISQKEVCDFIDALKDEYDREGVWLYNKRNSVKAFDLILSNGQNIKIVVKRFKKPNFIQRIIYSYLKKSKAIRSYTHAAILRERGFNTPHEIAYVEDNHRGLLEYAYYICEFSDEKPIKDCYLDGCEYNQQFADEFAVFMAQLHEKNILHKDLNSTNVTYSYVNGHFSFSLIDLNRMQIKSLNGHFSKNAYLDNLTRYTSRMDLCEHVLRRYAENRGWDVLETIEKGMEIKKKHDENWRRRKAFIRKYLKHQKIEESSN